MRNAYNLPGSTRSGDEMDAPGLYAAVRIPGVRHSRFDAVFVWTFVAVLAVPAAVPLIVVLWVLSWLWR